jgi:hypothetical protein
MSRFYKTTATPTVDYGFEFPFDELFRAKEYKDKRHEKSLETLQTKYDKTMALNYAPDDEADVMRWRSQISDIYDKYSRMPDLSNAEGLIKRDIQETIPTDHVQDITFNYERWLAEQTNIANLKKENKFNPLDNKHIGTDGIPTLDQYDDKGVLIQKGDGRNFPVTTGHDYVKQKAMAESYFNNIPEHMRTAQNIAYKANNGKGDYGKLSSNLYTFYGSIKEKEINDLFTGAQNGDKASIEALEGLTYDMLLKTGMEFWGLNLPGKGTDDKGGSLGLNPEGYDSPYNQILSEMLHGGGELTSDRLVEFAGQVKEGGGTMPHSIAVSGTSGGPFDNRIILSPQIIPDLPFYLYDQTTGAWVDTPNASTLDKYQQGVQYQLLQKFYEGSDGPSLTPDNIDDITDLNGITEILKKWKAFDPDTQEADNFMLFDKHVYTRGFWSHLGLENKNAKNDWQPDKAAIKASATHSITQEDKDKVIAKLEGKIKESNDVLGPYYGGTMNPKQEAIILALKNLGITDPFGEKARMIYKKNEEAKASLDTKEREIFDQFTQVLSSDYFTNAHYDFVPLSGKNSFIEFDPEANKGEGENVIITYGNGFFTEDQIDAAIKRVGEDKAGVETEGDWWDFLGTTQNWRKTWGDDGEGLMTPTGKYIQITNSKGEKESVQLWQVPMIYRQSISHSNRFKYDNVEGDYSEGEQPIEYFNNELTDMLRINSATNISDYNKENRNIKDNFTINGFLGHHVPGVEQNLPFENQLNFESAKQANYNSIINGQIEDLEGNTGNASTGIVPQLDRLKTINPDLYNKLYEYLEPSLNYIHPDNAANLPEDKRDLESNMKQAITRIVQANSAINNNAHNHYAEAKTDTELNAAVRELLTTYSGVDNIIDSGNNERMGIENGVVKYPEKLKSVHKDAVALKPEGTWTDELDLSKSEYSGVSFKGTIAGPYLKKSALPAFKALAKWSQTNGNPIEVTSMFRIPSYNSHVGGAEHSNHTEGTTIDISLSSGQNLYQAYISGKAPFIRNMEMHEDGTGPHYHLVLRSGK